MYRNPCCLAGRHCWSALLPQQAAQEAGDQRAAQLEAEMADLQALLAHTQRHLDDSESEGRALEGALAQAQASARRDRQVG